MSNTAQDFDPEQGHEKCPGFNDFQDLPELQKVESSPLFSLPVVPEGESEANYFYEALSDEVKQEFQRASLSNLQERESLIEREKPAALHLIFIKLGMTPISHDENKNKEMTDKFMKEYQLANQEAACMDPDQLGDLFDTYEDHPVMQVLYRVANRTDRLRSAVVQMRKTSLVLLQNNPTAEPN